LLLAVSLKGRGTGGLSRPGGGFGFCFTEARDGTTFTCDGIGLTLLLWSSLMGTCLFGMPPLPLMATVVVAGLELHPFRVATTVYTPAWYGWAFRITGLSLTAVRPGPSQV
jgi:hypothetical protein